MTEHRVGIIMNGVTGRMGANQHLARSICAMRADGGIRVDDNTTIMPDPILVGRNENKLRKLSAAHGNIPWTTDLDAALQDDNFTVYFDAQTTPRRVEAVSQAIAAGKHVYCEKPTATSVEDALHLYTLANEKGVKHGVVQDKLWLPGLVKLKYLIDTEFFGTIHSVKADFGYWVFTGKNQPAQRPSWNYRDEDGGGIIMDMLCHWRYVVDNLFGNVASVSCTGATHIAKRHDEQGEPYTATADDAAYATFLTDRGILCQFNSSWCTRVRRDDLLTIQVDGNKGSAVAGLRNCWVQHDAFTPKPVWNPDLPSPINFYETWDTMPDNLPTENAFRAQWDLFLRHVVLDTPFRWDLMEGAKGVQLAMIGLESWRGRRWVDVPAL